MLNGELCKFINQRPYCNEHAPQQTAQEREDIATEKMLKRAKAKSAAVKMTRSILG